jgi:uncharacterized protein YkwD
MGGRGAELRAAEGILLVLQLGVQLAAQGATRYDGDGALPARLEAERWLINRARYAPEREADAVGLTNSSPNGHPDHDVCEDTTGANDFGATTNAWAPWGVSRPPMAPNAELSTAANKHCKDMAETGIFQHESPSSNYYPFGSSPTQRASLEGYTNQIVGYYENIVDGWTGSSAGYPAVGYAPLDVHVDLFVDTTADTRGHRQGILNATAREVGLGTFRTNYFSAGFYYTEDYDTQDFGRTSSNHFFTDTMFSDANTNGMYDEGEGVSNVEVHLWNGTNEAAWYDVSQPSGNFAVPINDLPDGRTIAVQVVNRSGSARWLTMPTGYTTLGELYLTNNGAAVYGLFTQPSSYTNVGFRNTAAVFAESLTGAGTNMSIAFSALRRAAYDVQSRDSPWTNWTTFVTVTGTGMTASAIDSGQGDRARPSAVATRFYRVLLKKD